MSSCLVLRRHLSLFLSTALEKRVSTTEGGCLFRRHSTVRSRCCSSNEGKRSPGCESSWCSSTQKPQPARGGALPCPQMPAGSTWQRGGTESGPWGGRASCFPAAITGRPCLCLHQQPTAPEPEQWGAAAWWEQPWGFEVLGFKGRLPQPLWEG